MAYAIDAINEQVLANIDKLGEPKRLTYLPEPEPSELWCPAISVEDHAFEPSTLFDRVPARLRDAAPHMEEVYGRPAWIITGRTLFVHGMDGSSGRPLAEARVMAIRPEQFRRGVWDPEAYLADMDLNGIWGSVCFPSANFMSGRYLNEFSDLDVSIACVRAYNDWLLEEWCSHAPDRLTGSQVPVLADPEAAAAEIRRNAARGFTCVSFNECPQAVGFATIHSNAWDPFFEACVETGTVINLHPGGSETKSGTSFGGPLAVSSALFNLNSATAATDWLFSQVPLRYPDLKIAFSGGGLSWVPFVMERVKRAYRLRDECRGLPGGPVPWPDEAPHPVDVFASSFWFSSNEDPVAFRHLEEIDPLKVMIDVDYPHPDSSWPHTQERLRLELENVPDDLIRRICYENAAELYRFPRPPDSLLARSVVGVRSQQ